jgi:hypothetical protein
MIMKVNKPAWKASLHWTQILRKGLLEGEFLLSACFKAGCTATRGVDILQILDRDHFSSAPATFFGRLQRQVFQIGSNNRSFVEIQVPA